ncbi:MAG: 4-(cytidine 5'-diphospho)-2-C-methyl-D-erythritol kinase [Acutalibacteraceae bacterium]|nr:4-(cytidine 5'-diphospho)-2-C-methyl-D-erythritol kinase [Acutalibacteraceae bacterium]
MLTHTVQTCAKINLMLDCVEKRNDGYHELDMIMQSVDLCDKVTLALNDSGIVTCKGIDIPDDKNIAVKAAKIFFEFCGKSNLGAEIVIEKNIPDCGGLAGGSSDAAAVLRILDELIGDKDMYMLSSIALQVGSDVPFALFGGTLHAQGRGEVLEQVQPLPECYIVIKMCGKKESTGKAFDVLDNMKKPPHPDIDNFIGVLNTGDIDKIAPLCQNSFSVIYDFEDIKNTMQGFGATGVSLSGAGPAVFGIFKDEKSALECADSLGDAYFCKPTPISVYFE